MNPLAVIEIVIVVLFFMLPCLLGGLPVHERSSGSSSTTPRSSPSASLHRLAIWWQVSAKKWFTGPIRTIDPAETP